MTQLQNVAAYKAKLQENIVRAVFEASMTEQEDGSRLCVLMSGEIIESLVTLCGLLASQSKATSTPAHLREYGESFRKLMIQAVREAQAMPEAPDWLKPAVYNG